MVLELLQNAPAVKVPPALSLANDSALGIDIKSTPVRQKSTVESYLPGEKIIINLPSDFVDFRDFYLTMFAQITTPGAGSTYDRFSMPFGSIVEKIECFFGSTKVVSIENYGLLRAIWRAAKPSAVTNNLDEGSSTPATRAAQSVAGRQYIFRPEIQLLEEVLPLHKSSMPFRIELTLGDVNSVLESDGTNPVFTVSQVYAHYRTMVVPDSYDALLDAKIASGSFLIPFRSWSEYNDTTLSGNSVTIQIGSARFKSVNRLLAVMRGLADSQDLTVDGKMNTFNANGLSTLSLKVGQRIFPPDFYDLNIDTNFYELMQVFVNTTNNRYHGRDRFGDILGAATWSTGSTVMPFDLRDDQGVDEDLYGNGIDTSSGNNILLLRINLGGAPAATQKTSTYTEYEAVLKWCSGGKVEYAN